MMGSRLQCANMKRFASQPVEVELASPTLDSLGRLEPAAPMAVRIEGERRAVLRIVRRWRSSKNDRGDTYLKRHWFELAIEGASVVLYYDRAATGRQPHWWLFTIEEPD